MCGAARATQSVCVCHAIGLLRRGREGGNQISIDVVHVFVVCRTVLAWVTSSPDASLRAVRLAGASLACTFPVGKRVGSLAKRAMPLWTACSALLHTFHACRSHVERFLKVRFGVLRSTVVFRDCRRHNFSTLRLGSSWPKPAIDKTAEKNDDDLFGGVQSKDAAEDEARCMSLRFSGN